MKTADQVMAIVDVLLLSDLPDDVVRAACRGILSDGYDEGLEEPISQSTVDEAYEKGRLQGRADFETVAARRDELATKLHELGQKLQKEKGVETVRPAASWIPAPPPKWCVTAGSTWRQASELPTSVGWKVFSDDGLVSTCPVYWDGEDFVAVEVFRLRGRQKWAEFPPDMPTHDGGPITSGIAGAAFKAGGLVAKCPETGLFVPASSSSKWPHLFWSNR